MLIVKLNHILFFKARSSQNLSEDDEDAKLRQFNLPADLMPVMVWFHGGGYVRGGSSQFGPQFLMREGHDVVLVTVNYRLGVFGNWIPYWNFKTWLQIIHFCFRIFKYRRSEFTW